MMRWRSEAPPKPDSSSSEVSHSASKDSNNNLLDTTTASTATQDVSYENSGFSRARLEDGDQSNGGDETMASVDVLTGQQHIEHKESSEDENIYNNNSTNRTKRNSTFYARSGSEVDLPGMNTEGTERSGAGSKSLSEDDDGADHATEDDDSRSETNMPWKPQNVQSTCEFTHNILDYAQKRESGCKKAEYSSVTTDELGNRWRLIVYVNGNGRASNHHLSLFLQVADADDLPFGWKKSVSYVLTLEHPSGGSLSYAKRNPDKTFKLCPKAIDWGWSQFITSDRIQQEGFVHADSLTVRAQVSVKSSSVEIDEEDAELYLKCAVEEGDAQAVKLCLEQGASVNCQFKDDLYTPLHTACSSGTAAGCMEVLQLLLEKGADGNACNKWRETPLLIAANNGHRLAVEALLQHGANPSLCSEAGWSALTFAAHKGYDDIVALLIRAGAPVNCPVTEDLSTPLHKACAGSKHGHLAAVKLLLEGGADVHALNKWRETPLLTAANHGQAGAVKALLANDADPCKCTDTGWSPLSIAAYKGHDDVVRILLEYGAPTEEDDPTLSALLQAATKGLPDTVELLLRHGADHTVTTKKGDTALSILVEQNLIDAAVEMVTEYNASIPRCSRDRKKVQRARLLINLRMKQLEKESKENPDSSDDEETDDDDSRKNVAQHAHENDEIMSVSSSVDSKGGKKRKKNLSKVSAEEKARAAEEALLLELEQEDAKAKKVELEANSKRAKKKKKKERERQIKLQEEQERQLKEEKEMKEREERERIQKEKEEKERKELEHKLQIEREREMREILERDKLSKRKEREEREKREKEPKQYLRNRKVINRESVGSVSPSASRSSSTEKRPSTNRQPKGRKVATDPTPNRKIVSPKSKNSKAVAPLGGNRRWETASSKVLNNSSPLPVAAPSAAVAHTHPGPLIPDPETLTAKEKQSVPNQESVRVEQSSNAPTQRLDGRTFDKGLVAPSQQPDVQSNVDSSRSNGQQNTHAQFNGDISVEHPAISLFRKEKISELLQRCTAALGNLVDGVAFRKVIYHWIVRSSHMQNPYIDPIIPSWTDTAELVSFFQRQFIAENRRQLIQKGADMGASLNMEALKEMGSSIALFCQTLAKQVLEYRKQIEQQLPPDWTDESLGMTLSDRSIHANGSVGPVVTISWANRTHIFLPSLTYTTLRDRFVGGTRSSRFLTSVFVTKLWYETSRMITKDTPLDYCISPSTHVVLSLEASVSAELFSDPFTAFSSNVFWGRYDQVDALFGGQKPFAREDHGSEEVLARHGFSISAFLPLDNVVSSKYIDRMIYILDTASTLNAPVSFAVFVHGDCFYDIPRNGLTANDVHLLDPRLGQLQNKGMYIRRAEILPAGKHVYGVREGNGASDISMSDSLFILLQNDFGHSRFGLNDLSLSRILTSMSLPYLETQTSMSEIGLTTNFTENPDIHLTQAPGYPSENVVKMSPNPRNIMVTDYVASDVGNIATNPYSPIGKGKEVSYRARRGRLFALEDDDGDEDQTVDHMMSGMLNNFDVAGLFKNTSVGSDNVDIEAISLMGIGPPMHGSVNVGNPQQLNRNP